MLRDNNTFNSPLEITDRKVYDFYRQNRKKVAKGLNQYNLWVKAINGLFLTIRDMAVQSEGGVHVEGLGYFCNIVRPKKRKLRIKNSLFSIKKTYYIPHLFTDVELQDWTMSDAFDFWYRWHIKKLSRNYKIHPELIDNMRITADFASKLEQHTKWQKEFDYRSMLLDKLNKRKN